MGLTRALRILANVPADASPADGRVFAHVTPGLPLPELSSPFVVSTSSLSTIVWAELLGKAGIPCTRAEAMSVPAIAKARHVVAPKVAGTPLRVLAGETPLPKQPGWIARTDDGISPWHRMLWTVDDIIFTGWSLWAAKRGFADELLATSRIGRDRWTFDSDGQIIVDGDPVDDQRKVILIPGPHEGILQYGSTTVRHARQLLANAATAGTTPSAQMELHQTGGEPMTKDDRTELIEGWAAARRGEFGGVAFTNESIETKEHGSIDGQLLVEGRNASAVDCARIVGVAAAMVDATVPKASLTYETTEGRGLEHTEYGIDPYMEAIAGRLSLDDVVPRGQRTRFDITSDVGEVKPTGPTEDD